MERGTALQDPKNSPANQNLPLREGHNKVSAQKIKKEIFQLQKLNSTATGFPNNQTLDSTAQGNPK